MTELGTVSVVDAEGVRAVGRVEEIGQVPTYLALRVLNHVYCNIDDLQGAKFNLCDVPIQMFIEIVESRGSAAGAFTILKSSVRMVAEHWALRVTLRHFGYLNPIPTDTIHIFGDWVYVVDFDLEGESAWLRDMTIFLMLETEWPTT